MTFILEGEREREEEGKIRDVDTTKILDRMRNFR